MSWFHRNYRRFLIWLGYRDWNPIISMYVSFHTRRIIWECAWTGERQESTWSSGYGYPFPIQTTMLIDYKTYDAILAGAKYYRIGHSVYLLDIEAMAVSARGVNKSNTIMNILIAANTCQTIK